MMYGGESMEFLRFHVFQDISTTTRQRYAAGNHDCHSAQTSGAVITNHSGTKSCQWYDWGGTSGQGPV